MNRKLKGIGPMADHMRTSLNCDAVAACNPRKTTGSLGSDGCGGNGGMPGSQGSGRAPTARELVHAYRHARDHFRIGSTGQPPDRHPSR